MKRILSVLFAIDSPFGKGGKEKKMKTLPKGAKVVTISYPLSSQEENFFRLYKSFEVSFPWGSTNAYLHIKE